MKIKLTNLSDLIDAMAKAAKDNKDKPLENVMDEMLERAVDAAEGCGSDTCPNCKGEGGMRGLIKTMRTDLGQLLPTLDRPAVEELLMKVCENMMIAYYGLPTPLDRIVAEGVGQAFEKTAAANPAFKVVYDMQERMNEEDTKH